MLYKPWVNYIRFMIKYLIVLIGLNAFVIVVRTQNAMSLYNSHVIDNIIVKMIYVLKDDVKIITTAI